MVADLFVSGLVLLYLVERTLVATSNPNFVPSVILLGSFLVPITFVTYLYGRLPNWEVSLPAIAVCFLWGGVLGTVVARTLEYDVARALGFLPKFAIGIIEESAKLMVPLVFYFAGRGRERAYSPECVAGVFSEARIRHGEWGRGIGALRGYIGD
jgi:RsiW-degrading membrane proteinase PrsW (M82 family)